AQLTDANFSGAVLNGVSLNHSRLNHADFHGATWSSVDADTADFQGADLQGLKADASTVYFADFTEANLQGATLSGPDLEWAILCRTQMPLGKPAERENRDCHAPVDPGPVPAANPYVIVTGSLQRPPGRAVIQGTIRWNTTGIAFGMTAGDV